MDNPDANPNYFDSNCNHISAGNFAKILEALFPERPDSLSRILKGYVQATENAGSKSNEKKRRDIVSWTNGSIFQTDWCVWNANDETIIKNGYFNCWFARCWCRKC